MIDTQGRDQVVIVGFEQSTITQECLWQIKEEHNNVSVVSPFDLVIDDSRAYLVSVAKEKKLRREVIEKLKGAALVTFVHSTTIIQGDADIRPGTFIAPNSSVYFNAELGEHTMVGPYSMISHRTRIGTGTMLHPGTMIAGSCTIGDYCLLGLRSTIIDKINICDDVFIGAGSLVTKSITLPGNYVGSPVRKVA